MSKQYFDYITGYDATAKAHKVKPKEFALAMLSHAREHQEYVLFNQITAEYAWQESGKPYYKVDDAAVGLFRGTKIDLPFSCLKFPFSVFEIRFSDTNPLKTRFGPVRSMLVQYSADEVVGKTLKRAKNPTPHMYLWIDVGEKESHSGFHGPLINYIHMQAIPDHIISEELYVLPLGEDGSTLREANIEKELIAIAISVCFLATSSDKIIRPDVLSKDLGAYIEAHRKHDAGRMRVITERAHRRGKIGYVVDGERELVHSYQEEHNANPTGRELSHRHSRSAHFRKLESGLVTFVRQCVVRKDLPARPI